MQQSRVRYIVFCGLFIALTVALKMVNINLFQYLRIGFGLIPVIVSGFLLGPGAGLLVGALADILGYFFFSWGQVYFPGYTFTYALAGFLPAFLCYHRTRENGRLYFTLNLQAPRLFWRMLVCIGVSQLLNSVLLNTLFLEWTGQGKFIISFPQRLLTQCLMVPIFTAVSLAAMKAYGRYIRTGTLKNTLF